MPNLMVKHKFFFRIRKRREIMGKFQIIVAGRGSLRTKPGQHARRPFIKPANTQSISLPKEQEMYAYVYEEFRIPAQQRQQSVSSEDIFGYNISIKFKKP